MSKQPRAPTGQPGKFAAIVNLVVILGLLVLATPTMLLALVLLLPTVMVYAVDPVPGKSSARAVVLFGLAAACPAFDLLWRAGHTVDTAMTVAMDIHRLALCWASQGAGWLLTQILPMLVGLTLDADASRRINTLERRRAELAQDWS